MLARVIQRACTAAIAGSRSVHTLPELPYNCSALEPVISGEIMELHHSKHHATYVNNLNTAEASMKDCVDRGDVAGAIALQGALRFNGGGHINHSIFWKNLSPNGGGIPSGDLAAAIERDFGSFDNLRATMSAKTVAIQGSGWGWLGYDKVRGQLSVATCANQDPLEPTTGLVPLLGIDVWEHAYYLQYRNVRPDYVKAIWDIVNWDDVAERFKAAAK